MTALPMWALVEAAIAAHVEYKRAKAARAEAIRARESADRIVDAAWKAVCKADKDVEHAVVQEAARRGEAVTP